MNFRPAEAFPPGEFLREELDERGWSQLDFSAITGKDVRTINEIINGKRSITPETALVISKALGTSPDIWLGLEAQYRLWLASEQTPDDDVSRRAKLYEFPVRDMSLRGWGIDHSASLAVLERQLAAFFGVDSFDDAVPTIAHAAKNSGGRDLRPAQIAWLFRAKQLAERVPANKYSEKKLREAENEMISLLASPEDVRLVPKILADAGVRFVAVEGLPGLKVDGVCFWLDKNAPVIAMSLRFDRIDNFWFVLRHEMEHVLRGDARGIALSEVVPDSDLEANIKSENMPEQERLANAAAEEFCMPREVVDHFVMSFSPFYSRTKIEAFASLHRRHPGIVVGQLHHRDLPHKNLRRLLVSVRQFITRTAITDGWGHMPQLG